MDRAVDILHPLASLEWRECRGPPVTVSGTAQAVWLKDKVYVGGGARSGNRRDEARLYIYTPATDEWTTLDTPVFWFGLTTYHSQLVLVGGREYVGESVVGEPTNKLWTLSENGQWQETLSPMPTPCTDASAVSHGDLLLVITASYPNKVYVYNGHHWASTQHPPQRLYSVKSTVFNGHWYLMESGGIVYSASLDSLLANCQPSETSQPSSLWKRLTDVPSRCCCPAVFGNRLVSVGKRLTDTTITSSLYAYSSHTQSWIHLGDTCTPISLISNIFGFIATPCAVPLPSNELMIVSEQTAFKSRLTLTPFDPESSFTLRAVSSLESAAGIPVMTTLSYYTHRIQNILGLSVTFNLDLDGVLSFWISGILWLPPSWRNLLLIIRHLLHLDELAQKMETCLSAGATEELSPIATRGKQGDEVDEQVRLKDNEIFESVRQKIADLEHTVNELSQIPIKKEVLEDDQRDIKLFIHEEKPVAHLPGVKTESKEEPLTLEGEPHALLSDKREIREEAVPVTKAETMSVQPTTATWNLRGVEVCGEVTVVIHSSHDQQIPWPGYGLRLNIPKGCLPAGMEQCTINIKASLAGQYEFPENSHLVSAIFWLRCEDVQEFTKPITVEIQHCAKSENITNLSFVRAVCSQEQLPYTFKQLPGGNFTSHSSYGVIELNSFSGVGATQKGSKDRNYCSRLFYMPWFLKLRKQEIDFVVSWDTKAHLTAIENNYREKGALVGPHQPVKFQADSISLDIPMEGLSIQGWKITPLIRPVVTKEQVDGFRKGTSIPCCQLTARVMEKGEEIPPLNFQVKLEGAKYPHDVFTIDLPAEDPNSQPVETFGDLAAADRPGPPPSKRSRLDASEPSASGASTAGPSSASGLDTKLMKPELKDLLKELYSKASKWMSIGVLLDVDKGRLDAIKTAENHAPDDCLCEMLAIWLNKVSPPPSWAAIADAMEVLGDQKLTDQLRTKYHVPPHQN